MRRPEPAIAVALAVACALLALGISAPGSDYRHEAMPAFTALVDGDLRGFLDLTPVGYAGSVLVRAPFALLAAALGAGPTGIYRAGALVCLLGVAGLAFALVGVMRARGREVWGIAATAAVVVLAPIVLAVLDVGHPEEALTGALVVGSVLAALAGRPVWAGLALGTAIACKQWALLAVAPVLLAAPDRRPRLCLAAGAAAVTLWAPVALVDVGGFQAQSGALAQTGWIFKPQQLWWPLRAARALPGGGIGFDGPAWVGGLAHPLIVSLAAPLAGLHWWRRRRLEACDALALLGLLLLLRCLLDPWNCVYYAIPAIMSLTAWEAHTRRGLPVLGIGVTALTWLSFVGLRPYLGWDGLAIAYLAWSVPLVSALGIRLYGPPLRLWPRAARPYAVSSAMAARTSPSGT
jgi:glycosyl transferase family 87